ncbi:hypothetical protein [Mesorhizobium sp.]|uniref:hypothetical protein n=1 Tax=Mesorhizobium sp. TaxID=1871066 RepID=UPI000FE61CFF|nr:hypothetical protein [Mesorhizobium sp.]RWO22816.1 MAG: hypothetical protein EOS09_19290 [Mesorhizobium sp.]
MRPLLWHLRARKTLLSLHHGCGIRVIADLSRRAKRGLTATAGIEQRSKDFLEGHLSLSTFTTAAGDLLGRPRSGNWCCHRRAGKDSRSRGCCCLFGRWRKRPAILWGGNWRDLIWLLIAAAGRLHALHEQLLQLRTCILWCRC